jgi:hypothetical protein
MEYEMRVYNLFNRHVCNLRSDGGGEFVNKAMSDYCMKHGIHQQRTVPHTPEQNGRAERPNRTILESALSQLIHARLPKTFIGWAVLNAVYTKNRSPHAALHKKTPYEAWTGVKPDLRNLRVFGTRCYVHVPKATRTKLDPKAKEMIFVGYSESQKGWKLYDPETKREIVSCHVVFGSEFFSPNPDTVEIIQEHIQEFTFNDYEANVIPAAEDAGVDEPGAAEAEVVDAGVADANQPDDAFDDPWSGSDDELISYFTKQVVPMQDAPTYEEAMAGPHRKEFEAAIAREYDNMRRHEVFKPCLLPPGAKLLDTKLVLKIKEAKDANTPPKFKARLCGKGFRQVEGLDYGETFAPVASFDSIRALLSICANLDYELDTVDVVAAFLNAPLQEEIYIRPPDGYPMKNKEKKFVLRLYKTLYGLKQAPYEWNRELDKLLLKLGFKATKSDPCMYVGNYKAQKCYILVYVDDMLLATKDRKIMANLKAAIKAEYDITDNGPIEFYLNMHFERNRQKRTIYIHQQTKIQRLLDEMGMEKYPRHNTPADSNLGLTSLHSPQNTTEQNEMKDVPFKAVLGKALYLAISCRPDIATAVSIVARFSHNPGEEHWLALLRILGYLGKSQGYKLQLGGSTGSEMELFAYADADWGGETESRKSRTGYVICINKSPIIWKSKLQTCVAQSSTEAEFVAIAHCSQSIMWLQTFMGELGLPTQRPCMVYEDNQSCIRIINNPKHHHGIKHVDIKLKFIRDEHLRGEHITIQKISTVNQVADILTKNLPQMPFSKHRASIGLVCL